MKKLIKTVSLIFCIVTVQIALAQKAASILSQRSPDKNTRFEIRVSQNHEVEYRVLNKEIDIVNWSPLNIELNKNRFIGIKSEIISSNKTALRETIKCSLGENALIQNHYNQLIVNFSEDNGILFSIIARVFDSNIAFKYSLPKQAGLDSFYIIKENTNFCFNHSFLVYQNQSESIFSPIEINELKNSTDIPSTLTSPNLYISLNEANNTDYTKAVLVKGNNKNSLQVSFNNDSVRSAAGFMSPWRTISFSNTAIGLCKNSELLYKLNDAPDANKNFDWIKPGKLIREITLTTQGAVNCINFAKRMNLEYIMFDAGWYGKGYAAEHDPDSDPTKVVAAINMPEVIKYAGENNLGVILYINYIGLRKYGADILFPLYKSWGVKGLKFGFVNGLTQDGISWLMGALKKAQDHGFVINVHDNYKPTGVSRTIPALLTQEGIRGNENNPDAFHNTVLPFTRFLSGAADNTFCFPNQNESFNNGILSKKLQVSKAQQLALPVIFFSPLQSVFWYGLPLDYKKDEEIEFYKYLPTVWDKTIYLKGEIGEYISVARKKDNAWFVGNITAFKDRTDELELKFLDKGKKYNAIIYEDDGIGGIKKSSLTVDKKSKLKFSIKAKGGQAVMIVPNKK